MIIARKFRGCLAKAYKIFKTTYKMSNNLYAFKNYLVFYKFKNSVLPAPYVVFFLKQLIN